MGKIAEEWRSLPDSEKQRYKRLANENSTIYSFNKLKEYQRLMDKAVDRRSNGVGVVKKSLSSYNFFMKSRMQEYIEEAKKKGEEINRKELFKKVGEEWGNIEDSELLIKLQEMAEGDMARYMDEIKDFIKNRNEHEADDGMGRKLTFRHPYYC